LSNLIHLVYNSAATHAFTDEELEELLCKSRNKNAARGITGMLLYVDGCFFQILEGPKEAVEALAERIRLDPRHNRMTTIIHEPIAQRAFGEWSMGFTRLSVDDVGEIDGLNDFFSTAQVLTEIDSGRAKKLLLAFKQGRWRVKLAAPTLPAPPLTVVSEATSPKAGNSLLAEPRPAFTFAFQPIVDATNRRIAGYEALVRGLHQESATDVLQRIPLGEIVTFDEDARRMAIGLAARLGINTNLHLNSILHTRPGAPCTIESTLATAAHCGIPASRIILEIKHEASMNDPAALASCLREYRSHGLRISIDDFGSGHAGLALLDYYQPEVISLCMWLVRSIEGYGARQAILRGLVQTCGDLGIDIIAKGVETTEEYCWLRDEGIELFQGFLIAKPGFESLPRPMLPAEVM
jgi:blue light- and temperature-responsive anti-repressor